MYVGFWDFVCYLWPDIPIFHHFPRFLMCFWCVTEHFVFMHLLRIYICWHMLTISSLWRSARILATKMDELTTKMESWKLMCLVGSGVLSSICQTVHPGVCLILNFPSLKNLKLYICCILCTCCTGLFYRIQPWDISYNYLSIHFHLVIIFMMQGPTD